MYAVSIIQPWAYAIAIGKKDIENRTWVPHKKYIGQRIAIHASNKEHDQADLDRARDDYGLNLQPWRWEDSYGCIVATAILDSIVVATTSKYYTGRKHYGKNYYGWVLKDVHRCKPIPCTGSLGLWRVPASVLRRLPEECR